MLAAQGNESINALALRILEAAAGLRGRRELLERYITWTEEDLVEFEDALRAQRRIDDDLWR